MTNLTFFLYVSPVIVTGCVGLGAVLFVRLMPRPSPGPVGNVAWPKPSVASRRG